MNTESRRKAFSLGCDLMVDTMTAIIVGSWKVDGACDPVPACERMQKALLDGDHAMIESLTDSIAEAVARAREAGDFVPTTLAEAAFIRRATEIAQAHYAEHFALAMAA